ncbi:MAG: hypothetical protein INF91_03710, partial [Alphaproteobacteria bacterium]|nr:hypothetical protein [Alphaproteobacteria bacterium]
MGPFLPLLVAFAEPDQHGGAAAVAPPAAEAQEDAAERRRPGEQPELPAPIRQDNPGAISAPPPQAFPHDHIPVPDRWRLIEAVGVKERLWDPYHQNT